LFIAAITQQTKNKKNNSPRTMAAMSVGGWRQVDERKKTHRRVIKKNK
jgi:hypothetical protein